ncbi:hypothetical protein SUDANB180_07729 (plasmid) [Streptomyces sp. enrichment culture]
MAENEKKAAAVIGGGTVKGPVTIGGITITGTRKDTKKK